MPYLKSVIDMGHAHFFRAVEGAAPEFLFCTAKRCSVPASRNRLYPTEPIRCPACSAVDYIGNGALARCMTCGLGVKN